MKRLIFAFCACVIRTGFALIDQPDVLKLSGTGYHDDGWFSYETSIYSDVPSVLFDTKADFILSPHYAAAIRKIVIQARPSTDSVTRPLLLRPFVNGRETGTNEYACVLNMSDATNGFSFFSFDFSPDESVDAFRLCPRDGGTGNWIVARMLVLFGEREADEESVLREYAEELPVPGNLHVSDFSTSSLVLEAEAVDGAVGYRFRVVRLEGTPRTVMREDFDQIADDLRMTEGWSLTSENATVTACTDSTDSTYIDKSGSSIQRALKIAKGKSSGSPVQVEVLSPPATAAITGYSFMSKRASGESSDTVRVLGRAADAADDWQELGEHEIGTSMRQSAGAVDAQLGIVRLKFVFSADYSTCRNASLDTIRIVYGGNETRAPMVDPETKVDEARLAVADLAMGRYAYQIQAVGGTLRDSSWTEEKVIDLAWANHPVEKPEGVHASFQDGRLTLAWNAVEGADHYLVTVRTVGYPAETVVADKLVTDTVVILPEVTELGEYEVLVTAVASGEKSTAISDATAVSIALGKIGAVKAKAVDAETISASWDEIPFAQGYLVSVRMDGKEVKSMQTEAPSAVIGGLSEDGLYTLAVRPLPGDGDELVTESGTVDMSVMKPRPTVPVSFRSLKGAGLYAEDFSSLSTVRSGTDVKALDLPYWQVRSAGAEPLKLSYTSSCGSTACGVFIVSDAARTAASYMLATHANGSGGAMVGLAFANDGSFLVRNLQLSFDAVQRSFQNDPKTQEVEYLVTDGAVTIDADGDWRKIEGLATTAPLTKEKMEEGQTECRTACGPLPLGDVTLSPGQVLILRWRDEAKSASPMMGVDNVRLAFDVEEQAGFKMILR